jgi:hypothetical protein
MKFKNLHMVVYIAQETCVCNMILYYSSSFYTYTHRRKIEY